MRPYRLAAGLVLGVLAGSIAADEAPGGEAEKAATACLAEAVYFEARGTSETAREAVANVVVNRAKAADFPDTVCAVVTDGCQFSYQCDGRPETLGDPEDRAEAVETAEEVLDGEARNPTEGALYFHADEMAPDWAAGRKPTAELGGHLFYR